MAKDEPQQSPAETSTKQEPAPGDVRSSAEAGRQPGEGGPAAPRPVGWRFLFEHPAHAVALGLGSGLIRPGSGTWGTLLAWGIFDVLAPGGAADTRTALIVVAVALIVGTWSTERASAMLGEADPSTIVVDEMVAFWLVLVMLPAGAHWFGFQVLGFVLFRMFDILKPPPIGTIDRRWKNAFGVMADDLVAAFYTLLVIAALMRLALLRQ
jgi:phosphatidylglycerophosphatase A